VNVLIAGGSGYLGSALAERLRAAGEGASILTRGPSDPEGSVPRYHWDPERGAFDRKALEGVDAVVNLAGENLSTGRWTASRRKRFHASRVGATRLLVERLAEADPRPRTLVSASGVGYYGNRGEEPLTEASAPGSGFLAELCLAWEGAAAAAGAAGMRVVITRFGVVMGPGDGALGMLIRVFRLGIGGRLGSGRQWMSWVSLEDAIAALRIALARADLAGSVNVVAPEPVRNAELARTLGRVLHRPAILPAPALALRLVFGGMADEAMLASGRVLPARLPALGFRYALPTFEEAVLKAVATA